MRFAIGTAMLGGAPVKRARAAGSTTSAGSGRAVLGIRASGRLSTYCKATSRYMLWRRAAEERRLSVEAASRTLQAEGTTGMGVSPDSRKFSCSEQ